MIDLSTPALVEAIKANLLEWYRHVGSSRKAELYEDEELTWFITGLPVYLLNCVLHTRVEPDAVDAMIDIGHPEREATRAELHQWGASALLLLWLQLNPALDTRCL